MSNITTKLIALDDLSTVTGGTTAYCHTPPCNPPPCHQPPSNQPPAPTQPPHKNWPIDDWKNWQNVRFGNCYRYWYRPVAQ